MQLHKLAVVLFLLSGGNHETRGGESITHSDIEFANVDGHSLKLDLYLPDNQNAPLAVFIHGGSWKQGSKDRCYVSWLTDHGFAVASISYRLSGKAIFPAQIHDCKAAVRWLRANASKYGYSTNRIAVTGRSAGGHLAVLLGTTGGVRELEGNVGGNLDYSSGVDAIVDYFGAMDFIQRTKTQDRKSV
ncbi:MAG: alpha/beta hydrolase, partial [Planctomycetaceae bacterium]